MKYFLACEGKSEVDLINGLLDNDQLIFSKHDIFDEMPLVCRQPSDWLAEINILPPKEQIIFYRIGDKLTDKFDMSCLGSRIQYCEVKKVCTKPEIEILVIINEGKMSEFRKTKKKAKTFAKDEIKGFTTFSSYCENNDLVDAIKEYKRIKKNNKNELYLADLLK